MSETVVLWILGAFVTVLTMGAGGLTAFLFSINGRVRALEIFLMTSVKGAAEILHNDHDPYEMDKELDDLVRAYRQNHYDLTMAQWKRMRELCKKVMEDKTAPKSDRLAANTLYSFAMLADTLAEHKLMRFPK